MKNIFYKSKNYNYPGCSIDEITDNEYLNGFNFKIVDGTEYNIIIKNNEMTLGDGEGNMLGDKNIGAWNYGKVFKDLIDNEGIKLRANDEQEECGEFDFGGEEEGEGEGELQSQNQSSQIETEIQNKDSINSKILFLKKKYGAIFNTDQITQISLGLEKNLDVSIYTKFKFHWSQMEQIRLGLEKGLDVSIYAKSEFEWVQMDEIRLGLEAGLDVSIYAKSKFGRMQMDEIRLGLEAGLDASIYAKSEFGWNQMNEIRLGLEAGLDVSIYAKPEFKQNRMKELRLELEQELNNK